MNAILKRIEQLSYSKYNYYLRFIYDSATGLALILIALVLASSENLNEIWWVLVLGLIAGISIQGFIEYAFHRWLFHLPGSAYLKGHIEHHDKPLSYISLPWIVSQLIFLVLWLLFYALTQSAIWSSLMTAGIIMRYLLHAGLHHSFHHMNVPLKLWRKLKAYHEIHHRLPDRNFGLTSTFWDHVFKTHYLSKKDAIIKH